MKKMPLQIVVHYGEIGTKGNNRPVFERHLERNILRSMGGAASASVDKVNQRFLVGVEGGLDTALERLGRVFGVAWYAPAVLSGLSYEEIAEAVVGLAKGVANPSTRTFALACRRTNKGFPLTSHELAVRLGDEVSRRLGLGVNLSAPDLPVHVDVLDDRAVVYSRKRKGLGGLPVGVSGRVVHLLSGGIDSPVAAWLLMKRGCNPVFLHFYVAGDVSDVLDSKLVGLVKALSPFSGKASLVLLPFAPYQVGTTEVADQHEPLVFRRFMRMAAEKVAGRLDASAISTGDNLAQVASQTLQNLVCMDRGSSLPVLRPLLTYDKDEIIGLSKTIGTYELSIGEYKDCCSIISRHPKTRLSPELVDSYSDRLNLRDLVEQTLDLGHLVTYDPSGDRLEPRSLRGQPGETGVADHPPDVPSAPQLHEDVG